MVLTTSKSKTSNFINELRICDPQICNMRILGSQFAYLGMAICVFGDRNLQLAYLGIALRNSRIWGSQFRFTNLLDGYKTEFHAPTELTEKITTGCLSYLFPLGFWCF